MGVSVVSVLRAPGNSPAHPIQGRPHSRWTLHTEIWRRKARTTCPASRQAVRAERLCCAGAGDTLRRSLVRNIQGAVLSSLRARVGVGFGSSEGADSAGVAGRVLRGSSACLAVFVLAASVAVAVPPRAVAATGPADQPTPESDETAVGTSRTPAIASQAANLTASAGAGAGASEGAGPVVETGTDTGASADGNNGGGANAGEPRDPVIASTPPPPRNSYNR